MRAIGIDLGTTNSLAAIADKDIRVLPTRAGEQLTPSVVSFVKKRRAEEGEIVVGRQAVANAVRAPEETIFSIKRLMGAIYGEPRIEEVRQHISYRLADPPPPEDEDQGVKAILNNQPYSPVDISAMILKAVRVDAEQSLGESVTHAVITVPAYFEERQRDATRQAAEQAGVKVLKIIDEPTAAAMFFGVGKEGERHRVLVFDLGGGTFDISIIQMTGGQYQVLEITGDRWLGGDDFDRAIIQRMIEWVKEEYNFDPSNDKDFLGKAKAEAEKVKIALGSLQSAEIFAPLSVKIPNQGPVDIAMSVSREEFESDIAPLVDRTIELVNRALRNQSFTPEDISEVLLVGGSTSVPLVRQAVVDVFGVQKVRRHVNPMECVALGAAILANSHEIKDGSVVNMSERTLVEVTAMHLGIAVVKGDNPDTFAPIIEKGTPYPLTEPMKRLFTPVEENQKLIRVAVYEGLSDLASLNDQQGIIEFPLPRGIGAANSVEISFNYDANRVLTVGVRVVGTDLVIRETLRRNTARVNRPKNLLDDWREDLQPSVRAGKQFLQTYGAFMHEADRAELEELIKQGEQALEGDNQVEGRRATQSLQNKIFGCGTASQLFIAERAMQDAPPREAKQIAEAVKCIRAAHADDDQASVDQFSMALRLTVAHLMARRPEDVEDKTRPLGGLRDSS
jgi:molecular chaperone DnaK (HSP70)